MAKLQIRRLGYALGAEISVPYEALDDDAVIAEIKEAWWEHILLCFPNQPLSFGEQERFCSRFGELDATRSRPNIRAPGHNAVTLIVNKAATINGRRLNATMADQWHQDLEY